MPRQKKDEVGNCWCPCECQKEDTVANSKAKIKKYVESIFQNHSEKTYGDLEAVLDKYMQHGLGPNLIQYLNGRKAHFNKKYAKLVDEIDENIDSHYWDEFVREFSKQSLKR
jgi:ABC-type sulfate transport system substrate-binding protein